MPFFQREILCCSLQGRKLDLLTISSPANLRLDAALRAGQPPGPDASCGVVPPRFIIFISARVHPGETPCSFVMHGLLLFLTSDHPRARELREVAILKVVPMLNPDGVFLGNYRCNSIGLDLNRMWHAPLPDTAPTIHSMRQSAQQYTQHPLCRLEMILDMHAHSTCMNCFIFANMPDDPRQMDDVASFPRSLGTHAAAFALTGCKFDTDPSKVGTGRRALSVALPGVHCYTLEVSMFCASQGNARGEAFLPASYTEMGHQIGLALHEHYCSVRGHLAAGSLGGASLQGAPGVAQGARQMLINRPPQRALAGRAMSAAPSTTPTTAATAAVAAVAAVAASRYGGTIGRWGLAAEYCATGHSTLHAQHSGATSAEHTRASGGSVPPKSAVVRSDGAHASSARPSLSTGGMTVCATVLDGAEREAAHTLRVSGLRGADNTLLRRSSKGRAAAVAAAAVVEAHH